MKKQITKFALINLAFIFVICFLVLLVSAVSIDFVNVTIANGSIITDSTITYNVSVNTIPLELMSLSVYLLDSSLGVVQVSSPISGSFLSVEDGLHYFYAEATFNDSSAMQTELRAVQVENPLFVRLHDPTPEDGVVFNMFKNNFTIKAETNKVPINFYFYLLNLTGSLVASFDDAPNKTSEVLFDNLSEGNYTFYVQAIVNNTNNLSTAPRGIFVDITPIVVSNYSLSPGLPSALYLNEHFYFNLDNLIVSEFPARISVKIYFNGTMNNSAGPYLVNNVSELLELRFTIANISSPGIYHVYLATRDYFGNTNESLLGNISFSSPATPQNGGGGGSGRRQSLLNSTNITLNDTGNQTSSEVPLNFSDTGESALPKNDNFFSRITGAVTGAFGSPSSTVFYIIALVVIVYAIFAMRNYFAKEDDYRKKNGKNSKKESAS